MNPSRTSRLGGILVVAAFLTAACSSPAPAPTAAPASGGAATTAATSAPAAAAQPSSAGPSGKVVIALGSEPPTLDPQAINDIGERTVNDNIYETLIQRNPADMSLVPSLADKWEQTNPTTWRFHLHPNVSFTNGEPFNADAVAFSVKRAIDPKLNSQLAQYYEGMQDAKKVDDLTVDIVTAGPDPILPTRMTFMRMIPPKYAGDPNFGNAPIGTGPYKFVAWAKGQHITLAANPDYWGPKPTIKDVEVRTIGDATTRLSALTAGEVDLINNLLPEQADQAPKAVDSPSVEAHIFRFNTKSGPFADVRLRQAANYAVDKDGIVKSLFNGKATPLQGQTINKYVFGFNPDLKPYPFDPDKAKQLLQDAGTPTPKITMVSQSGHFLKDREETEAVAGMLRKVGFDVQPDIEEHSNWLKILFDLKNPPDMIYTSSSNDLFDADANQPGFFSCGGSVSAYCNKEVDPLLVQARTETDPQKREDEYHKVLSILRDDAPALYLTNPNDSYGLSKQLNWQPRTDGRMIVKEMSLSR